MTNKVHARGNRVTPFDPGPVVIIKDLKEKEQRHIVLTVITTNEDARFLAMLTQLLPVSDTFISCLKATQGSLEAARLTCKSLCRFIDQNIQSVALSATPAEHKRRTTKQLPPVLSPWPRCSSLELTLHPAARSDKTSLESLATLPFMGLCLASRQRLTTLKLTSVLPVTGPNRPPPAWDAELAVMQVALSLPHLRYLDLAHLYGVCNSDPKAQQMFDALAALPHLEQLHLPPRTTIKPIRTLAAATQLHTLCLSGNYGLNPLVLGGLESLSNLTHLDLGTGRTFNVDTRDGASRGDWLFLAQLLGNLPPRLRRLHFTLGESRSTWLLSALRSEIILQLNDSGHLISFDVVQTQCRSALPPMHISHLADILLRCPRLMPGEEQRHRLTRLCLARVDARHGPVSVTSPALQPLRTLLAGSAVVEVGELIAGDEAEALPAVDLLGWPKAVLLVGPWIPFYVKVHLNAAEAATAPAVLPAAEGPSGWVPATQAQLPTVQAPQQPQQPEMEIGPQEGPLEGPQEGPQEGPLEGPQEGPQEGPLEGPQEVAQEAAQEVGQQLDEDVESVEVIPPPPPPPPLPPMREADRRARSKSTADAVGKRVVDRLLRPADDCLLEDYSARLKPEAPRLLVPPKWPLIGMSSCVAFGAVMLALAYEQVMNMDNMKKDILLSLFVLLIIASCYYAIRYWRVSRAIARSATAVAEAEAQDEHVTAPRLPRKPGEEIPPMFVLHGSFVSALAPSHGALSSWLNRVEEQAKLVNRTRGHTSTSEPYLLSYTILPVPTSAVLVECSSEPHAVEAVATAAANYFDSPLGSVGSGVGPRAVQSQRVDTSVQGQLVGPGKVGPVVERYTQALTEELQEVWDSRHSAGGLEDIATGGAHSKREALGRLVELMKQLGRVQPKRRLHEE